MAHINTQLEFPNTTRQFLKGCNSLSFENSTLDALQETNSSVSSFVSRTRTRVTSKAGTKALGMYGKNS